MTYVRYRVRAKMVSRTRRVEVRRNKGEDEAEGQPLWRVRNKRMEV